MPTPRETTPPLGLPVGSVRAILAILALAGGMALLYAGRIDFVEMLAMTGPSTAMYFHERRPG